MAGRSDAGALRAVEQRHLGLAALSPGAGQRHETGMPLLKVQEAQGEIIFFGEERASAEKTE